MNLLEGLSVLYHVLREREGLFWHLPWGSRLVHTLQSMFPAHCGCPHSQATSEPVFSVSQCGLQYLLSFPTLQLQPAWAQLSFVLVIHYLILSTFNVIQLIHVGLHVKKGAGAASAKTSEHIGDEQDQ
jgi:hypothetical protein